MPEKSRPGSLASRLMATQRLLAIEDDPDIAEFLRAYFRASGYDLIHLDPDDPQQVIDAVIEHKPDMILLDMTLRGFSGHTVYRLLRDDEQFAFLPVLVVSADTTAERHVGDHAGLDGFVSKPFNVQTLADSVAQHIEAAQALAAVARDDETGILTQRYLTARLTDELRAARPFEHPLSFALIRLRTMEALGAKVTGEREQYIIRELLDFVRTRLPAGAVLGRTDSKELVVLLPGIGPEVLAADLAAALSEARTALVLPGGAEVELQIVAGVAGYPAHARTPDELYMAADAAMADAVDSGATLRVAV